MPLRPPIKLDDVLEADWQRDVVKLARTLGWTFIYHTFNSQRSAHGFPDLLMLRERQIALELKREKGKLTDQQKGWLRALHAAGQEAYVARPRDLDLLAAVLNARPLLEPTEAMARLHHQTREELG